MKVDGTLHSLVQGVSQQPYQIRLPGQCQLQENCHSDPVLQLMRRPPMQHIAELQPLIVNAQYYDFTVYDLDYILVAGLNSLHIYDVHGNQQMLTINNSANNYLDGSRLTFTTFQNITYIANTAKVVAMESTVYPYAANSSIVHLNGGQYGRTYIVTVNFLGTSSTFSYTAPNGAVSTDTPKVASTYIATQLAAAFNANGALTAHFSITQSDDVLWIQSTDGTAFTTSVDDGSAGTILFSMDNTVAQVGALPRFAPQGYVASITGSGTANPQTNEDDTYYLVFQTNASGYSTGQGFGQPGTWVEGVAPNIPYLLDQTTMPITLSYTVATNSFTLDIGNWFGRQIGDAETNANPSFIGQTINHLNVFQSRLVVLSGINLIMSQTNQVGSNSVRDFWRKTATALFATDPIDISSTAENVSNMIAAVPFNQNLVLFAEKAQFILPGTQAVTPQTASLILTTAFETAFGPDKTCTPQAAGLNVFFATKYGSFTGIREFFTENLLNTNNSRPTTEHVLQYIQGQPLRMASSTTFNTMMLLTDADQTILYVYEYLINQGQKTQASWSKWIFSYPIQYIFFRQELAYVISNINGNLHLKVISLNMVPDAGLPYQVCLDRKTVNTVAGNTLANPLPDMPPINQMVFVQSTGCPYPGLAAKVASYDGSTITFTDNMGGGQIIAGQKYLSRYQPTMPIIKDREEVPIMRSKLRIAEWILDIQNTGYIAYTINTPYDSPITGDFEGRYMDDPDNNLNVPAIYTGTFTVPYRLDASDSQLEFNSDSHMQFNIVNLTWRGHFTKKGMHMHDHERY